VRPSFPVQVDDVRFIRSKLVFPCALLCALPAVSCGDVYYNVLHSVRDFLAASPGIEIRQGAVIIAGGGSFDVGSTVAGTPRDVVFTIVNNSTGEMDLTGTPLLAITAGPAAVPAGVVLICWINVVLFPSGMASMWRPRISRIVSPTHTQSVSCAMASFGLVMDASYHGESVMSIQ
jgi:hypothetical protein